MEVAEHGVQLAEAGAVSGLRTWLQSWQIIVGEPLQSFLVGSAGTPATVEPMMLIEKLGKELLSGGFGGGVGGSPDFLAAPLKANPISRIPFVR
jgi:hypothetical protein